MSEQEQKNQNSSEHRGHSHHSSKRHHHHHHHHHSHNRRNKESKFKQFVRHNRKKLLKIAGIAVIVALLVLIAFLMDEHISFKDEVEEETPSAVKETGTTIQLEIPLFTKEVPLVSSAVVSYMNAEDGVPISEILSLYDDSTERMDAGLPVTLSYSVKGIPDGYSVKGAKILVSENENFTSSKVYTLKTGGTEVDVYHLKTGTKYYYRVELTLSNGSVTSASGTFQTADTPRFLLIEGVYNVRDIGGWKTADGKAIRQGLLYRGTELDGAVSPSCSITQNGVNTMLATLGIRMDMDLRYAADNVNGTDALGAGVTHRYYGASMYMGVFEEEGKAAMRAVFADLADVNNYPVYLHCTQGLDRAGTVCYVLEALLGVEEADLMKDYQLSALHYKALWAMDQMETFVAHFKTLEGATMQEKAETYLLSIGVTPEEIQSIRSIFLEE